MKNISVKELEKLGFKETKRIGTYIEYTNELGIEVLYDGDFYMYAPRGRITLENTKPLESLLRGIEGNLERKTSNTRVGIITYEEDSVYSLDDIIKSLLELKEKGATSIEVDLVSNYEVEIDFYCKKEETDEEWKDRKNKYFEIINSVKKSCEKKDREQYERLKNKFEK